MSEIKTIRLEVTGMSCQGCVNAVQAAITNTGGVLSGKVSLEERSAEVTYDPSQVSESAIIQVIREAGYDASLSA